MAKVYFLIPVFLVLLSTCCHSQVLQMLTQIQETQKDILNRITELESKQKVMDSTLQAVKEVQESAIGSLLQFVRSDEVATFQNISNSNVDECNADSCGSHGTCVNEPSGYRCICPSGFIEQNGTCQELKCASPYEMVEGVGCLYHVNIRKSWYEAKEYCKSLGGGRLYEKGSPDIYEQIINHFSIDFNTWIGVRHLKWASNGKQVPTELWEEGEPDRDDHCGHIYPFPKIGDFACPARSKSLCQLV